MARGSLLVARRYDPCINVGQFWCLFVFLLLKTAVLPCQVPLQLPERPVHDARDARGRYARDGRNARYARDGRNAWQYARNAGYGRDARDAGYGTIAVWSPRWSWRVPRVRCPALLQTERPYFDKSIHPIGFRAFDSNTTAKPQSVRLVKAQLKVIFQRRVLSKNHPSAPIKRREIYLLRMQMPQMPTASFGPPPWGAEERFLFSPEKASNKQWKHAKTLPFECSMESNWFQAQTKNEANRNPLFITWSHLTTPIQGGNWISEAQHRKQTTYHMERSKNIKNHRHT